MITPATTNDVLIYLLGNETTLNEATGVTLKAAKRGEGLEAWWTMRDALLLESDGGWQGLSAWMLCLYRRMIETFPHVERGFGDVVKTKLTRDLPTIPLPNSGTLEFVSSMVSGPRKKRPKPSEWPPRSLLHFDKVGDRIIKCNGFEGLNVEIPAVVRTIKAGELRRLRANAPEYVPDDADMEVLSPEWPNGCGLVGDLMPTQSPLLPDTYTVGYDVFPAPPCRAILEVITKGRGLDALLDVGGYREAFYAASYFPEEQLAVAIAAVARAHPRFEEAVDV